MSRPHVAKCDNCSKQTEMPSRLWKMPDGWYQIHMSVGGAQGDLADHESRILEMDLCSARCLAEKGITEFRAVGNGEYSEFRELMRGMCSPEEMDWLDQGRHKA